jgi:hypothetical protein
MRKLFLPNEPILKIVEKQIIAGSKVIFGGPKQASKRTQTKPFIYGIIPFTYGD